MNAAPTPRLDALIIGGDVPDEFLGRHVRERMRLTVGGTTASFPYLRALAMHNGNPDDALQECCRDGLPFVSINAPYLHQYLCAQGLSVDTIPIITGHDEHLREALSKSPRAIVISTTFLPLSAHIDKLAATLKQLSPDSLIIAGGIQIWKSYQHRTLAESGQLPADVVEAVGAHSYFMTEPAETPIDLFVVSPTGERSLATVLHSLRAGDDPRQLPNTAYAADGRWQMGTLVAEPSDDVAVDWSSLPFALPDTFIPVQAGQGCGFDCHFCDFRGLRPLRIRPIDSILAEIRSIPPRHGIRKIYFTDDNLFAYTERTLTMCRAIIDAGMPVRWRGMARVSAITPESAQLLAQSGCVELLLGIESGDPQMLARMGKESSPEAILQGIRLLDEAGVSTKSTSIVGYPGETAQSVGRTVELINAYPTGPRAIHRYLIFRFGVLPLSTVSRPEARARYGLKGYGFDWSHDSMDAAEAEEWLAWMHEQISEEHCPSYPLEVPYLPDVPIAQLSRAVTLRNRLATACREHDAEPSAVDPIGWTQLLDCFRA
jgi:anaerobic magnesium-protoporphyrin IX monomethyl ester cyclase